MRRAGRRVRRASSVFDIDKTMIIGDFGRTRSHAHASSQGVGQDTFQSTPFTLLQYSRWLHHWSSCNQRFPSLNFVILVNMSRRPASKYVRGEQHDKPKPFFHTDV